MDLSHHREDYNKGALDLKDALGNPIEQFKLWIEEALTHEKEANAVILSTIDKAGHPDARTVLLKGIKDGELAFYTNHRSKKGQQISDNNNCHLLFLWINLHKQVRIKGKARMMSQDEAQIYFNTRPRGSQIGAWSSPQSEIISKRELLEKNVAFYTKKFENVDSIPIPDFWGGYYIEPIEIEFWQGRSSRLHDRLRYTKVDQKWNIKRLAP